MSGVADYTVADRAVRVLGADTGARPAFFIGSTGSVKGDYGTMALHTASHISGVFKLLHALTFVGLHQGSHALVVSSVGFMVLQVV